MKDEQPSARDPEVAVTVPRNALKKWQKVREFALGMPGAVEEFPWGESRPGRGAAVRWAEESHRVTAPKRLTAELEARAAPGPGDPERAG